MEIKELVINKSDYSESKIFSDTYKFDETKVTRKTENYKHSESSGGIITLTELNNGALTLQMYRFYDNGSYNIKGFCIGNFTGFGSISKQSNLKFSKSSPSVEVNRLDTTELLTLAKHLIKKFCVEGAVVKDYNSGKIYIINPYVISKSIALEWKEKLESLTFAKKLVPFVGAGGYPKEITSSFVSNYLTMLNIFLKPENIVIDFENNICKLNLYENITAEVKIKDKIAVKTLIVP